MKETNSGFSTWQPWKIEVRVPKSCLLTTLYMVLEVLVDVNGKISIKVTIRSINVLVAIDGEE